MVTQKLGGGEGWVTLIDIPKQNDMGKEKGNIRGKMLLPNLGASVCRTRDSSHTVCFLPRDGNTKIMQAIWIKGNTGYYSTVKDFPSAKVPLWRI